MMPCPQCGHPLEYIVELYREHTRVWRHIPWNETFQGFDFGESERADEECDDWTQLSLSCPNCEEDLGIYLTQDLKEIDGVHVDLATFDDPEEVELAGMEKRL